MNETQTEGIKIPRRALLKIGAVGTAAVAVGSASSIVVPELRRKGLYSANGVFDATSIALAGKIYDEVFPTSPLILSPFQDPLNVPKALAPVDWSEYSNWDSPPGPAYGQQSSYGNEQHQKWKGNSWDPDPIVYHIKTQVSTHSFTTSQVLPIDSAGRPAQSFDSSGTAYPVGTVRTLPDSTIYGFNGTLPGPMINAEYGKPVLVRFDNRLGDNPMNLDRQDFGAPDYSTLIHLHNAHTAPESDGNPHYSMTRGPQHHGFHAGSWVDQMYLNWPAGNDETEKQSFFWFHDHRMDHTGANVYKGMVGLYPIYDPTNGMDMGDETQGLHLPGVRTDNDDGSFDVKYDIPLALYDCRLDDGVTNHLDMHDSMGEYPAAGNPRRHPEWWGKTFFKHFPNHGFVGDIFTVNGTAYPVLEVERRKYRFRFLDCSVARIYELKLMSSTQGPKAAKDLGYIGNELQGQYRIPDAQQCMQFVQIASDGGLLTAPIKRDSFELWPAKRREFVVDFTRYQDGTPTTKGDVVYLTNVMTMPNGRMWSKSTRFSPDPRYKVPVLKFEIDDIAEDNSLPLTPNRPLRPLPPLPANWRTLLDNRLIFEVQRGGGGGELEWLINGKPFDATKPATSLKNPAGKTPLASPKRGSFNLWEIRNGGGGWVHPIHMHMEEHRTVMRNGRDVTTGGDKGHPDDVSREDVVALDPSESVIIYRGFRTFLGPYVAHCHNLMHEAHAMMIAWTITP